MTQLEEKFRILTKEDLFRKAKLQSDKCTDYTVAINLYYIARYFVVVFEARNKQVPIQVWNEFRNSLDHLMRHFANEDEYVKKDGSQKKAMEKHILRASLDIMKFVCLADQDWIEAFFKKYERSVLELVDNNSFAEDITTREVGCTRALEFAKTSDSDFGDDDQTNEVILGNYIDAVMLYENLRNDIEEKLPEVEKAYTKHESLRQQGKVLSRSEQIIITGVFTLIAFILGLLI